MINMLGNMRRHSLRLQHELHRWSICDPASHLLSESLTRVPFRIARSKSYMSSAGDSNGSRESWSSTESVVSTDSVCDVEGSKDQFRVVLLGASGVGKTALASIFAGAADSMDSDDCELYAGEKPSNLHLLTTFIVSFLCERVQLLVVIWG